MNNILHPKQKLPDKKSLAFHKKSAKKFAAIAKAKNGILKLKYLELCFNQWILCQNYNRAASVAKSCLETVENSLGMEFRTNNLIKLKDHWKANYQAYFAYAKMEPIMKRIRILERFGRITATYDRFMRLIGRNGNINGILQSLNAELSKIAWAALENMLGRDSLSIVMGLPLDLKSIAFLAENCKNCGDVLKKRSKAKAAQWFDLAAKLYFSASEARIANTPTYRIGMKNPSAFFFQKSGNYQIASSLSFAIVQEGSLKNPFYFLTRKKSNHITGWSVILENGCLLPNHIEQAVLCSNMQYEINISEKYSMVA